MISLGKVSKTILSRLQVQVVPSLPNNQPVIKLPRITNHVQHNDTAFSDSIQKRQTIRDVISGYTQYLEAFAVLESSQR